MTGWAAAIKRNWERILFSSLGIVLIAFGVNALWRADVTGAVSALAFGFFSFIFSSISKFKKFKGFGIEGELWEDKKNEAEKLINEFRRLNALMANELISLKIKSNRFQSENRWNEIFELRKEIIFNNQGDLIDISNSDKDIIVFFNIDNSTDMRNHVNAWLNSARSKLDEYININHPQPIQDNFGYAQKINLREKIFSDYVQNTLIVQATNKKIAASARAKISQVQRDLESNFGLKVAIPQELHALIDEVERIEKCNVTDLEKMVRGQNTPASPPDKP